MSDFLISPGVQQPEHNRLRGREATDAHDQYSLTTHDHDADYSATGHSHDRTDAAGNTVISYATGGSAIGFGKTFSAAPVVTANIEAPSAAHPVIVYVNTVTTTGFTAVLYDGNGAEIAAGGAIRVYWHATPAGV